MAVSSGAERFTEIETRQHEPFLIVKLEAFVLPGNWYFIEYTQDFVFWWIYDFVFIGNGIRLVYYVSYDDFEDVDPFFDLEAPAFWRLSKLP